MKYIITFLSLIILTSCKNEIKVVFPEDVLNEVSQYIQACNYVVVIYIDSSSCAPCSLQNLDFWNPHKEELKDNNTGILLVIHNSDEQAVLDLFKTMRITFPFIFDKGGKFKANNEVFKYARGNTFVMDKNRNAVFNESPIANEQVWKQFIGLINK
jgi:hypothetical protein